MENNKKEMKKILVCGGAGFLGSNLCETLLNQGHSVTALDNFYTGREENLINCHKDKNFTFINHDIIKPLPDNFKTRSSFDEIYNLACPASPPHYQKDPIYTTKVSVIGTLHLLEYCKKNSSKFFQASTSEVYGDPIEHPQTENYWGNVNCTGIRSCYDEGKRCAESLIFDFYRHHKVAVKVVRIFNTYGPKMDPKDGRVVSNFIIQALKGDDITIYGDGSQTRSFCYVDDLINGFIKLMESDNSITGPINMGNPTEFTMLELADKVLEKTTDSTSKLIFKDLPSDDPTRRRPNISKAKELLNWQPKFNLSAGLDKTISYFKDCI